MAEHASDPQSAAFRGAGPDDLVTDDQLAAMHASGELVDTTDEPAAPSPDDWDVERHPDGPKTLDEATAALAERVADPAAPDTDPDAYAEVII